jgi:hypothetical protein
MADLDEPEKVRFLTHIVGAVVVYYALIEHSLDGIVHCIHVRVPDAKKISKHYPYNAAAELKFLRESFEGLSSLSSFKDEAISLLDKIIPAADFRHDIVHGAISSFDFETGVFEFSRKIKGDSGAPSRKTLTITTPELVFHSRLLHALIDPASDLLKRLIETFDPDHAAQQTRGGP